MGPSVPVALTPAASPTEPPVPPLPSAELDVGTCDIPLHLVAVAFGFLLFINRSVAVVYILSMESARWFTGDDFCDLVVNLPGGQDMRDFCIGRLLYARFSSELRAAVAVAALTISAASCLQENPPTAEVEGAPPAALNSSPQITDFAVYAQNSATLRDRTVLTGGDVGVHVAGSGPFLVAGYELALSASVQVDTTHNVIANRVLLDGAKVGDVQTNQLSVQNGGTYSKKYAFPATMPALPTPALASAGTMAVKVKPSFAVQIGPGAYGAVSVGTQGILRLQGGVYHLASLQLDDGARIEALGPVQVRVAGRLSTLARVWIGAGTGVTLTAADLRIEVSGKNGTGGGLTDTPIAAAFGNDATILGEILVPNGTLQIGQRNTVTGALVGRDVYVDMDSKVTFQSGMAVLTCAQSCNDGNPCTKDTCTGSVCSYPPTCGKACGPNSVCDDGGHCLSLADEPTACDDPNARPKPNEVMVWDWDHYAGPCATLSAPFPPDPSNEGRYPNSSFFPPMKNDTISSVRVGCGVRAILFDPLAYDTPEQDSSHPFVIPPPDPSKYWYRGRRATYEAGSSHDRIADSDIFQLGPNVNDNTSSIIVQWEDDRRVAYAYLGDYPDDSETAAFKEQPQGLAHSPTHWFFTTTWALMKIPLGQNLDQWAVELGTCVDRLNQEDWYAPQDWLIEKCTGTGPDAWPQPMKRLKWYPPIPPATLPVLLPGTIGLEGCAHMGDPDYAADPNDSTVGYVFVPLEKCFDQIARVAAYRADNLSLVGASKVSGGQCAFVAVDPQNHYLWTQYPADGGIDRYTISWDTLKNHQAGQDPLGFLQPLDCSAYPDTCTPREKWRYLSEPDVVPPPSSNLHWGGQGGVFDSRGRVLYLTDSGTRYHGIMAVNPDTGELLTETGDNYGPFSFQRGSDEEEEGIDYFDMWGKGYPGAGELHAILNFNVIPFPDSQVGNASVKHYTAWPERYCKTTPGEFEVTLWQEANFKGKCRTLTVGLYRGDRWTYPVSKGSKSMKLGAGVQATLFSGDNYGGDLRIVRGDTIDPCNSADSQTKGQISNWGSCGYRVWSVKVTPCFFGVCVPPVP